MTDTTPGTRIKAFSTIPRQYSCEMPSTFILIGRARAGLALDTGAAPAGNVFSLVGAELMISGFTAGDRLSIVLATISLTRLSGEALSSLCTSERRR